MTRGIAYISFASGLYGLERVALSTCELLSQDAATALFAPPGPIHDEAQRRQIRSIEFRSDLDLFRKLLHWGRRHAPVATITTSVRHAAIVRAAAPILSYMNGSGPVRHASIVHGGNTERASYAHKKWMALTGIPLIGVSEHVRDRLAVHGVPARCVTIVENFILPRELDEFPARQPFKPGEKVRRGVLISRLDRVKRLDLLIDALRYNPAVRKAFEFEVVGGPGDASDEISQAAAELGTPQIVGFDANPGERLIRADFFLHTCPVEAFGLAVLDAMACRVPVVVPSVGGTGCLVKDRETGLTFDPQRKGDLERALLTLQTMTSGELNAMTSRAHALVRTRYSGQHQREQLLKALGLREAGVLQLWNALTRGPVTR